MIRRLAVALLLAAATPAIAQPARGQVHPAPDMLQRLPDELLGLRAIRAGGSPVVTYFGADGASGTGILAAAMRVPQALSFDQLREMARATFRRAGIRQVLREGSFTSPHWPGATTFFGEYETESGTKQTWIVEADGSRLSLIATIHSDADRQRAEAEVARTVFGGARIEPRLGPPLVIAAPLALPEEAPMNPPRLIPLVLLLVVVVGIIWYLN
jgi:hypothetical protein